MNFEMEAVAYVGTVAERIAQAGVRPLSRESVTGCPTCFSYVAGPDSEGRVRGGVVLIENPGAAHVWVETFDENTDTMQAVLRSVSIDHTATLSPRQVYGIEISSPLVSVDQPSYPPLEVGENGVLRSWIELDSGGTQNDQVTRAILHATGATSVSFRTDSSGPRPRTIASVASNEGGALELEYVVDDARKLVEIRTPMAGR